MKAQLFALFQMADLIFIDGYEATVYAWDENSWIYNTEDDEEGPVTFPRQYVEVTDFITATDSEGKERGISIHVHTPITDVYLNSEAGAENYRYWVINEESRDVATDHKA